MRRGKVFFVDFPIRQKNGPDNNLPPAAKADHLEMAVESLWALDPKQDQLYKAYGELWFIAPMC